MVEFTGDFADNASISNWKKPKKWIAKKIRAGVEILMTIKNRHDVRKDILAELSNAKDSVIIEHGYLTDKIIIKQLRRISRKGIAVRVILPDRSDGVWHANMYSAYKLMRPSVIRHI